MAYGPHTPADRAGCSPRSASTSIEALFADIPAAVRANGLDLPAADAELELAARLEELAGRNRVDLASFLGAGVYRHHIPATVDAVLSRGEFYDRLHAVPARDQPGHAPDDLRVPVAASPS